MIHMNAAASSSSAPCAIDRYSALTRDYKTRFGDKTVVVYQMGDFHQIMSIGDDDIHGIADAAGVYVGRKDKKNPVINRDNHLMCGWPVSLTCKYTDRLCAAGYTVVCVDKEPNTDREVVNVQKEATPKPHNAVEQYGAHMRAYTTRFGDKNVVVCKLGDFHQILSIRDGLVDIERLANIAGVRVARMHKKDPVITRDNFLMCGWPVAAARKYIDRLSAAGYKVVVV